MLAALDARIEDERSTFRFPVTDSQLRSIDRLGRERDRVLSRFLDVSEDL